MKKIILLAGFFLILVFPPKAWDQDQNYGNYGAGGAEYLRQMQQQQQTNEQKIQNEKQRSQNKTEGLQQNQFNKPLEMKDREAKQKQKGDLENDINSDNTK